MNRERWEEIRKKIEDSFKVIDRYEEDLEPGIAEVIEFDSPMGTLRASFITRPKVTGKKTLYSQRAGSGVSVDFEYSSDETVCHLEVEKLAPDGETWTPIDGSIL